MDVVVVDVSSVAVVADAVVVATKNLLNRRVTNAVWRKVAEMGTFLNTRKLL